MPFFLIEKHQKLPPSQKYLQKVAAEREDVQTIRSSFYDAEGVINNKVRSKQNDLHLYLYDAEGVINNRKRDEKNQMDLPSHCSYAANSWW